MTQARALGVAIAIALPLGALTLMACDLATFGARSTSSVFERATPALDEHWDWEMAGQALPSTIMQVEGLLRIIPEDEALLANATRAYLSLAFGWVEDEAEVLEIAGEDASSVRHRAALLYQRSADLALQLFELRHAEFREARAGSPAAFREWLDDEFDDREDAADLWWAGYAWGSHINAAHPHEPHADRDFAVAMVRRSVALDPSYYGSSGLAFLAYVATQRPGADMAQARRAWDRALEASGRSNLLIQLTMARTFAVRTHDRALYLSLLREILEADDVEPALRLSNMIAKRRARRDVPQVERHF